MKVILEAFQGKLRSEPMDWPDTTGYEIMMRLDLDPMPIFDWSKSPSIDDPRPIVKLGKFVSTGMHQVLPDKTTAVIYRLVGI